MCEIVRESLAEQIIHPQEKKVSQSVMVDLLQKLLLFITDIAASSYENFARVDKHVCDLQSSPILSTDQKFILIMISSVHGAVVARRINN